MIERDTIGFWIGRGMLWVCNEPTADGDGSELSTYSRLRVDECISISLHSVTSHLAAEKVIGVSRINCKNGKRCNLLSPPNLAQCSRCS
jgi:hypothetical protein